MEIRGAGELPCDICGGVDHDLLFVKEGFRHVRCTACGLVFVNPRLKSHLEYQSRSGTGSMGDEALTPSQIRRLQREIRELDGYRKLNRILEVGPGRGWFLGEAGAAGWETWGVEVNRDALRHLSNRNLDRVISESADSFHAPSESVDVVRIWDVIEHLESPKQAMVNVHRVLRPGGLVRISTTNFDSLSRRVNGPEWVYLNGSDHIVLFEPRTIERLLVDTGFGNTRIRTRSFNLRRKLYHPEQPLPDTRSLLMPVRKIIDELMRFTMLGHQMIVTAERR